MIFVVGLKMISQRIPATVFGKINQAGPQRVKIDISKAVDQRFALIDNHAFESVSPEITSAVMASVVVPGNSTLPTTIHDVIMARVDGLSEEAKSILQVGSVIILLVGGRGLLNQTGRRSRI